MIGGRERVRQEDDRVVRVGWMVDFTKVGGPGGLQGVIVYDGGAGKEMVRSSSGSLGGSTHSPMGGKLCNGGLGPSELRPPVADNISLFQKLIS